VCEAEARARCLAQCSSAGIPNSSISRPGGIFGYGPWIGQHQPEPEGDQLAYGDIHNAVLCVGLSAISNGFGVRLCDEFPESLWRIDADFAEPLLLVEVDRRGIHDDVHVTAAQSAPQPGIAVLDLSEIGGDPSENAAHPVPGRSSIKRDLDGRRTASEGIPALVHAFHELLGSIIDPLRFIAEMIKGAQAGQRLLEAAIPAE